MGGIGINIFESTTAQYYAFQNTQTHENVY